jgi:TRAP transporter 4TM/12TM fusion protein
MRIQKALRFAASGRARALGKAERVVIRGLGIFGSGLFLAISLGFYLNREIALFLFAAIVLVLAFLTTTGNPDRPTGRSYVAWLFSGAAFASCVYFVWMRPAHAERLPMIDDLTFTDVAFSVLLIFLVLEATRRCIGMALVLLVLAFLAYTVFGNLLIGSFAHRGFSLQEIIDHLVFSSNGLFGPALEVAAFLVVVFVLFGALLERAGGADFFYDLANALVGRQVGGASKVAVVSSGLYGSISGSPTADVVTTGAFSIPLMIRTGMSRVYAGAIEAAASTGGALLPPVMGSAAFLMADFTGIAYGSIALAALPSALLYYISVFLAVHFRAHRDGLKPTADANTPALRTVFRRHWAIVLPIGVLVWAVLALNRPAFAGAISCLAILPILLWRAGSAPEALRWLGAALADGMKGMVGVGVACAVAGLVVGTLAMTDLSGKISSALFALSMGSIVLTVVTAACVIVVLGMGMPTPAVYALSAVLAAPALTSLGVPVIAAHLFIVYLASMSAITPPVAVAAFAAASIAQGDPLRIAIIACRVAMVAFILPFLYLYEPALLLAAAPTQVALVLARLALAILFLNAGIEGFLHRRLDPIARGGFLTGGVLLLPAEGACSLIGLGVIVGSVLWIRIRRIGSVGAA